MTATNSCGFPVVFTAFPHPLRHFRQSLSAQRKTRVVALGSSSTAGTNNIVAFPARIEQRLRKANFGCVIDVLNRGIGGQEAAEELSRFESDVLAEQPALVIWQVGTNAAYRAGIYSPDEVEAALRVGLGWLTGTQRMDVIVMDLQYTAAIVEKPERLAFAVDMQRRIEQVTTAAGVNLFRRWDLMKGWCDAGLPLSALDDGHDDHLHMSECATANVSEVLAHAIMTSPAPVT
ncbi:SGNH/GDSL hydrolase family protein [Bradyrhizobium sp. SRS-191]|uniref:SGNH/GDSL hydrolase family protein n=1 Tax=Bradyrhizobium sp. SRS-191 TaxID=2962606 RepID=UPI00211DD140|nr:SGNH/GDSL hydrolase family protein [Bradyrhizobium sp. SRS-191]